MSGQLDRLKLTSTTYSGNQTFPAKQGRGYFFIVMTVGSGTISFGGGDGEIPLANAQHYEPYVCPTGVIDVTTAGTFVVVTN